MAEVKEGIKDAIEKRELRPRAWRDGLYDLEARAP
jgi:hypothetical protein